MKNLVFSDKDWPQKSALIISNQINNVLSRKEQCSVFLTGGRGAAKVYSFLANELQNCKGQIYYYLGDERCVNENHPESNYKMILETLFPDGLKNNQVLYKMYDDVDDAEIAASNYELIIPAKPDIVLLGLGDDGHIASLFPETNWQHSDGKKVTTAVSPVNGIQRITITKQVIENTSEIIVFAAGVGKQKVISELSGNLEKSNLPSSLALGGLWLLDESAAEGLENNLKKCIHQN